MSTIDDKTIQDFDEQWTRYDDNSGWYGSVELFEDVVSPLLSLDDIKHKSVVEIGSGTGRIVGMLSQAGASKIIAVEPAPGAYKNMLKNVKEMGLTNKVQGINARGDNWNSDEQLDLAVSVGVIQFIKDPSSTLKKCYDQLKPGGKIFLWLYSHEGNEAYLFFIKPIRFITTRIPHWALKIVIECLYWAAVGYKQLTKFFPLPLQKYLTTIWGPMSADKRRLVIYDQLNPTYAKYHKRSEAIAILEDAGFKNVKIHHRHGYSWSVLGEKPQ